MLMSIQNPTGQVRQKLHFIRAEWDDEAKVWVATFIGEMPCK